MFKGESHSLTPRKLCYAGKIDFTHSDSTLSQWNHVWFHSSILTNEHIVKTLNYRQATKEYGASAMCGLISYKKRYQSHVIMNWNKQLYTFIYTRYSDIYIFYG